MPGEPDLPGAAGEQHELLARLRAVVEARDAENAMLRAELAAALERQRRLELRVAELERRLFIYAIIRVGRKPGKAIRVAKHPIRIAITPKARSPTSSASAPTLPAQGVVNGQ